MSVKPRELIRLAATFSKTLATEMGILPNLKSKDFPLSSAISAKT
jgi:hypothetical protein